MHNSLLTASRAGRPQGSDAVDACEASCSSRASTSPDSVRGESSSPAAHGTASRVSGPARRLPRGAGGALLGSMLVMAALLSEAGVDAQVCNGNCWGHGRCLSNGTCSCFPGWQGAVDCSLRSCSKGVAWAGKSRRGANNAHSTEEMVECSAAGLCDRKTGQCTCFPGFIGESCQHTACPRGCSDSGMCLPIGTISRNLGVVPYSDSDPSWGALKGQIYTNWDANITHGCVCAPGYFGPDCSFAACPRGDDPVTGGHNARSITLQMSHPHRALNSADKFTFMFERETATFYATDSADTIAAAIRDMANIRGVTVSKAGSVAAGSTLYVIIGITQFASVENNFFQHDGNPPLSYFFCDTTGTANGLRAAVSPTAEDATYTVSIDGTGSRFLWTKDGGAVQGPVNIVSGGNFELDAAGSTVKLTFSPTTGRVVNEAWKIIVAEGTVIVLPETQCKVVDTDLGISLAAANYTGTTSQDFTIDIDGTRAADGSNRFIWKTSVTGSEFGDPVTISAGTPQLLTDGIKLTFASASGHMTGARWVLSASAPGVTVSSGRAAFMVARPTAQTAVQDVRVVISDGTVQPNLVQYSTAFNPSTGGYVMASDVLATNVNGLNIPYFPGNVTSMGFAAWFSGISGFATGMEWIVRSSGGGSAVAIAQPTSPLTVETSYGTQYNSTHTVSIVTPTTFSWSSTINGVTTTGINVPINDYWIGNTEVGNGVVLRFFAKNRQRGGVTWSFKASIDGTIEFTTVPTTRLQATTSGSTTSHTYFVRIYGSGTGTAGADQFEYSVDGGNFTGPYTIKAPTDAVGNSELGNGVTLRFSSNSGYAPGQLWTIQTTGSVLSWKTTPQPREFSMCSGRGVCGMTTGTCTCFDGYSGADCSIRSTVYMFANNEPGLLVKSQGIGFTGDVIRMETEKSPAPDFYFIQAFARNNRVFAIRGDGRAIMQQFETDSLYVDNGITLNYGNLTLTNSALVIKSLGMDIENGGARITQVNTQNNVLDLTAKVYGTVGYLGEVVHIQSIEEDLVSNYTDHYLLTASTGVMSHANQALPPTMTRRFAIQSNGRVNINTGGLFIDNPVPYMANPGTARQNVFFGGATIKGGISLVDYGMDVGNGGLRVNNDPGNPLTGHRQGDTTNSNEAVIMATAGATSFTGSLFRGDAPNALSRTSYNLIQVAGGSFEAFTVRGDGFTTINGGGLSVAAGGVKVGGGGISINGGGLQVNSGGAQINSGGIQVSEGGSPGLMAVGSISATSNIDVLRLAQTQASGYSQALLHLYGTAQSASYDFIRADAAGQPVFRVDGTGDIYLGVGGRVRITHDGYIQTRAADPLNLQSDNGQTVVVTGGSDDGTKSGSIVTVGGSGTGAIPAGSLSFIGGAQTGTAAGGNILLRGGDSTAGVSGGAGGTISLVSGSGAANTGAIVMKASTGGLSVSSAGSISIAATADATVSSTGGPLSLTGWNRVVIANTDGTGSVSLNAGQGGLWGASAGPVSVGAGSAYRWVAIRGGDATSVTNLGNVWDGGSVSLIGGNTAIANKQGGSIVLTAGNATTVGGTESGGGLSLLAGGSGTVANGGNILIRSGAAKVGGTPGYLRLQSGDGASIIELRSDSSGYFGAYGGVGSLFMGATNQIVTMGQGVALSSASAPLSITGGGLVSISSTFGDVAFKAGSTMSYDGSNIVMTSSGSVSLGSGGAISIYSGADSYLAITGGTANTYNGGKVSLIGGHVNMATGPQVPTAGDVFVQGGTANAPALFGIGGGAIMLGGASLDVNTAMGGSVSILGRGDPTNYYGGGSVLMRAGLGRVHSGAVSIASASGKAVMTFAKNDDVMINSASAPAGASTGKITMSAGTVFAAGGQTGVAITNDISGNIRIDNTAGAVSIFGNASVLAESTKGISLRTYNDVTGGGISLTSATAVSISAGYAGHVAIAGGDAYNPALTDGGSIFITGGSANYANFAGGSIALRGGKNTKVGAGSYGGAVSVLGYGDNIIGRGGSVLVEAQATVPKSNGGTVSVVAGGGDSRIEVAPASITVASQGNNVASATFGGFNLLTYLTARYTTVTACAAIDVSAATVLSFAGLSCGAGAMSMTNGRDGMLLVIVAGASPVVVQYAAGFASVTVAAGTGALVQLVTSTTSFDVVKLIQGA